MQSLCLGESTFEVEWCKMFVYEWVILLWRKECTQFYVLEGVLLKMRCS